VFLRKPMKKRMVLFLCTGDTCRGPMAAGYMRHVLAEKGVEDIDVRSAGVMTATGLLSTPEAIQLLNSVAVDLKRHRSTQLTPELIRRADLILGMTPFHVQFALRMAADSASARDKIHLFREFVGSDPKNYQIQDPMGHTLEVYKRVFREIRQACEILATMTFVTGRPMAPETASGRRAPKKPAPSAAPNRAGLPAKALPRPPPHLPVRPKDIRRASVLWQPPRQNHENRSRQRSCRTFAPRGGDGNRPSRRA